VIPAVLPTQFWSRRIQVPAIHLGNEWSSDSMDTVRDGNSDFQFLSELVLLPSDSVASSKRTADRAQGLTQSDLESLALLATKNHVIVRAFSNMQVLNSRAVPEMADWVSRAIKDETSRIHHALQFLEQICTTLEQTGCPVTVIKSLDHWPDLGSDLDLYTDAEPMNVIRTMRTHFDAKVEDRSWGDRLANKWNFVVPGLPELVEIHIGRLGQTGEQTAVTESLSRRTRHAKVGEHTFRVLAPEDRIIISTLQRMYRHFYIRLCDVVDNASLVDSQSVDFDYLHGLGSATGLWEGIATYLTIISGYVEAYRGYGASLPSLVTGSAKFRADQVHFRRDFLRVPILPHSLNLYAGELRTLLMKGQLRNSLRLSLLPGLATAAALEFKITGSDKGIW